MKIKLEFDSWAEMCEWMNRTTIEEVIPDPEMEGLAPMAPDPVPVAEAPAPVEETPAPEPAPAAPSYTLDALAGAMAALIDEDENKMGALAEMIQKYGVPAINALDTAHYDAFAEDLKALGAKL